MYNFFVEESARVGAAFGITGADYNHIVHVLRMRTGETFFVSAGGRQYLCRLAGISEDTVTAEILEEKEESTELPISVTLFQGLPKSDKLELIIQKAVELGADAVIPVEMHRSIVKIDEKKKNAKKERWQAIAEAAAKQSKRNRVPEISAPVSYKAAMELAKELDVFLVPYENEEGFSGTKAALARLTKGCKIGILIGPEGGFEEREIALAKEAGGLSVSLGRRILRTETAAITALGMCMLYAEEHFPEGSR